MPNEWAGVEQRKTALSTSQTSRNAPTARRRLVAGCGLGWGDVEPTWCTLYSLNALGGEAWGYGYRLGLGFTGY